MLLKKKVIPAMFGAFVCLGLVACGSDSTTTTGVGGTTTVDDPTGGTTGDTPTGSSSNSAHTIVLTYPVTNAIENLEGGIYRKIGKAIVTDNEGNPVPDDTTVYFNVIDSTMAKGTITSVDGDSITGSVLTDINPTLADGVATTFSTAYVTRNEAIRSIEAGDHLYLKGDNSSNYANGIENADAEDKNRIISSDGGAITGNTLAVTQDYVSNYPNSEYASGVTDYIVGASLLGAKVLGKTYDEEGAAQYTNIGYATTQNGIAEFVVDYPATRRELNTGCGISDIDARSLPLGSADVLLVASAGSQAITVDDRFCFSPIAPAIVSHGYNPVINAGAAATDWLIPVDVADANQVVIPYVTASFTSASNSQLVHINSVELADYLGNPSSVTDRNGDIYVKLNIDADATATSSDGATIVVSSYDGSTEISVSVLEDPSVVAVTDALTTSPSAPVISKTAAAGPKTSGVRLALADSGGDHASKTVYAVVNVTANTGGMTVALDGVYDAVNDWYTYTTDANGEFTSQVTVSAGAADDAADIVYFYGALEATASVSILP